MLFRLGVTEISRVSIETETKGVQIQGKVRSDNDLSHK